MVKGGRATKATKSPRRYRVRDAVTFGVLRGFHLEKSETIPPDLRLSLSGVTA
jgi:hypothetical protein